MIKKHLHKAIFIGMMSVMASGSSAYAGDWYISANVGHSDPTSTVFNDGTNGAGNPESSIESDVRYGAAIGLEILPALKLELEYSKASYNTDATRASGTGGRALDTFGTNAQLDVDLVMLNASYEFVNSSKFTPYLKGGVGSTIYDIDGGLFVSSSGGNTFGGFLPATFQYDGDGSEFAYFAGAGVAMELSEKIDITLEYRYSDLGEVATDFDDNGDRLQTDLKTNDIRAGIRYNF
jgi:opacity protein-like surface antigen